MSSRAEGEPGFLDTPSVTPEAERLCRWLQGHDWDFRAAAAERNVEPRVVYREWLESLGWNQSLAARLYRKASGKSVTRQAIDAQMKTFGVVRPLDLDKQLEAQDLAGGLDALAAIHAFIGERSSPERLVCEQQLALSESYRALGNYEGARQSLLEVVRLAREMRSPELASRAMQALPFLTYQVDRYGTRDDALVELLERTLPFLREEGDTESLALCCGRLGQELFPSDRERASALCAEAWELARASGSSRTVCCAVGWRVLAMSSPDQLDARLELLVPLAKEALQQEADVAYPIMTWLLNDLLEAGRCEEAAEARDAMRPLEDQTLAPWPQRYRATLAVMKGEWGEAQRLATPTKEAPLDSAAQIRSLQQYEAMKARGDWEDLAALAHWNLSQDAAHIASRIAMTAVSCLLGRHEEAASEFDAWAASDFDCVPVDFMRVSNLCRLAEVCHALDREQAAAVLYEQLLPHADRVSLIRVTAVIHGAVGRYLGLLAHTLGRWDEAARHYERAIDLDQRLEARPYLAWTRYDYARLLHAAGRDAARSAELCRAAALDAAAVGMGWLAEAARSLLDEA